MGGSKKKPVRRKAASAKKRTVERNIQFFQAVAGVADSGEIEVPDVESALEHLDTLPFSNAPVGRYMPEQSGNLLCGWPHDRKYPSLVLARVRRTDLPLMEQAGALTGLNLPNNAGISESVHAVFFKDGIVGIEFNFYGPRPSRIPAYFLRVTPDECLPFSLEALIRQDIAKQLRGLRQLRVFKLRVYRSFISEITQADASLGRVLTQTANLGNADVVEVVLQPKPHTRSEFLNNRLNAIARRVLRRTDMSGVLNFTVQGLNRETERLEEVDLLKEAIVTKKSLVRMDNRTNGIDTSAAFEAIAEAHAELSDAIGEASSVVIDSD